MADDHGMTSDRFQWDGPVLQPDQHGNRYQPSTLLQAPILPSPDKKGEDMMEDVRDMMLSPYDGAAKTVIWQICAGSGIGLVLGAVLMSLNVSSEVAKWVSLPGDLLVDLLKCLVIPMIFCAVVICIGELVQVGKAGYVTWRVLALFLMSALTSAATGTLIGIAFTPLFKVEQSIPPAKYPMLNLRCPDGTNVGMGVNGTLACANTATAFGLNDKNSLFTLRANKEYVHQSVTDQIVSILQVVIPTNITAGFASTSALSAISFGIVFGIALVRSVDRAREGENYPLLLIRQACVIFNKFLSVVVGIAPALMIFAIAGAMAQSPKSFSELHKVGYLVLALATGLLVLCFGIFGSVFYLTTHQNVLAFMSNIVPAQIFVFGCDSSLATLPVTMRCLDDSRQVSRALTRFVVPLGLNTNLNGTALFMPLALIFLAHTCDYADQLTPSKYVILTLLSALSSLGIAPVPHASLVVVMTLWATLFTGDMTSVFKLIISVDWISDRMRSVCNTTNMCILCGIIAEQCDETIMEDEDRLSHMFQS